MKDLDWIIKKGRSYGLTCEKVNDSTLRVYSNKFFFDSWLIEEKEDGFELYHLNKRKERRCCYHLQKKVKKKDKLWLLQRIHSHNRYVSLYKGKKRTNIVDNTLKRKERFKIY